jgi:hypothetical protein
MNSSRSEKSASELESNSVATCEPNPSYARAASALSAASARFASAWACSASALVSSRRVWTCWSLIWERELLVQLLEPGLGRLDLLLARRGRGEGCGAEERPEREDRGEAEPCPSEPSRARHQL